MDQNFIFLVSGFDGDEEAFTTYEKAREEFNQRLEQCRADPEFREFWFIEEGIGTEDPFVTVCGRWSDTPDAFYELILMRIPLN